MCEPLETAQSLGNDTHAVGTRVKRSMRARTSQRCVVLCVVRLWALPIDVCSNKDAGKGESGLPDPL